jgi:SpoVK/Ycf46/Vps4 family AAA+-type ATPase
MTSELIKQLFLSFNNKDEDLFLQIAKEYIEKEKRKKNSVFAKELEESLFNKRQPNTKERRFKNELPIPRDSEKGFPLLEIHNFDSYSLDDLVVNEEVKSQLEQIITEFKDSDILATYNLKYKKKILLCGRPGTGKTYSAQVISSIIHLPLIYIRFDSIISSYLGETATNLRKVFDYIEQGMSIILFDEFDIIGKNRDDNHEHGEIKRVVNNFLQMLDNYKGNSIILAATNHQYMLDPAIWRRFDDVIYYDLPNLKTRELIFFNYLRSIKKDDNLDLKLASKQTDGLSPSDIKMIVEEAIKLSIINSQNSLSMNNLDEAINKFLRREKVKNNQMKR